MLQDISTGPEVQQVQHSDDESGGGDAEGPPLVQEEIAGATPEAFSVHDAESANWLVSRIAECRSRAVRAAEWADRIASRSRHEEHHLLFRFEAQLRAWAHSELAKLRGRRKSIPLPGGTIGFR